MGKTNRLSHQLAIFILANKDLSWRFSAPWTRGSTLESCRSSSSPSRPLVDIFFISVLILLIFTSSSFLFLYSLRHCTTRRLKIEVGDFRRGSKETLLGGGEGGTLAPPMGSRSTYWISAFTGTYRIFWFFPLKWHSTSVSPFPFLSHPLSFLSLSPSPLHSIYFWLLLATVRRRLFLWQNAFSDYSSAKKRPQSR